MSNQLNHSELIDAYLTGQLGPEESKQLMQLLEKDPSLQEEFNLQQDMVNSLQEHRRLQLKSRLDNIEVGTGTGYTLPSAGALKLVAGAALLVLLGGGSWFAYHQLQPATDTEQPVAMSPAEPAEEISSAAPANASETSPQITSIQPEEETRELTSSDSEAGKTEQEAADLAKAPAQEMPVAAAEEDKALPAKSNKQPAESSKPAEENQMGDHAVARPEIVKPEVLTSFDEPDAVDSVPEANTPQDKLNEAHSFSNQNIEVTTKTDKQYPFHYMFHDNQLHIYGDFSQVPYEVLEVNTGTYTLYYLYHGGNYYELNPNQRKITRLKELKNEKIMQELEITRTQKLNR